MAFLGRFWSGPGNIREAGNQFSAGIPGSGVGDDPDFRDPAMPVLGEVDYCPGFPRSLRARDFVAPRHGDIALTS
jgi:hypothetical protein